MFFFQYEVSDRRCNLPQDPKWHVSLFPLPLPLIFIVIACNVYNKVLMLLLLINGIIALHDRKQSASNTSNRYLLVFLTMRVSFSESDEFKIGFKKALTKPPAQLRASSSQNILSLMTIIKENLLFGVHTNIFFVLYLAVDIKARSNLIISFIKVSLNSNLWCTNVQVNIKITDQKS